VARAYDIRWLVLERAHIVDAFAPIYVGTPPQADWVVAVADAGDAPIPAWRLFAVCLSAQDQRSVCQHATATAP
jgi:hypothetical protein